jgi:NAD(P)-dependent dehydrogenase (short-subunit alcohol dehydrogenase family)
MIDTTGWWKEDPMPGLLTGKVVVVTGGASGMGRAISVRAAEEGAAAVIVADLRQEPREGGEPTADLVVAAGSKAHFAQTDVTRPEDLERAVAAAFPYGGIDVMVNNAGVFGREDFFEWTEADYDRIMDVNVKGVFFGCQAAAKAMRGRGGAIVNLSSIGGIKGGGLFPTYCSSKGAVRLLTYSLGELLGPLGIRVNAIHPGVIDTSMTRVDAPLVSGEGESLSQIAIPLGRVGQARDVADAAAYLASDLASYVNGTSLIVDGGRTAS